MGVYSDAARLRDLLARAYPLLCVLARENGNNEKFVHEVRQALGEIPEDIGTAKQKWCGFQDKRCDERCGLYLEQEGRCALKRTDKELEVDW
jgi:hypothetical protein